VAACVILLIGIKMANNQSNHQSIISGMVLDPNRQPVTEARVYFIDGPVSLPDIAVLTDRNGEFTLTAPAPGTYKIGCSADGFASTTLAVNITTGQNVQVEIQLSR
jgi:carboxypeptidase family protein